MIVSQELEMTMANDAQQIKSVKVSYNNGDDIEGFVRTAKFIPLEVTLCKHVVRKGENSYHLIDFSAATSVEVTYNDGSQRVFV